VRRVRVALVGVGMIGASHAQALASSPLADLVVACDPDPAVGDRLPPGVPLVDELDAALGAAGVEAAFVCTPQHTHRAVVERAFAHGLAVFCEKPIAHDLADADAMAAAAQTSGRLLAIGHTLRFDPDYLTVQRAVASGELGRVVSIAARRNVPDFEGRIIARRTTLAVEVLVHDIDVLRWLAGPIERVHGEESRQGELGPGLVEAVVATVRLAGGAVATLESNWVMHSEGGAQADYRLSVVGTRGSAYAEYARPPVAIFGARPRFPVTSWLAEVHGVHTGALRTEDEHFLRCVRGSAEWPVSLADARAALAGALALDRSIADGRPVALAELG
jgi:myo-inositol 2-dehydrogenase / D-chiro-inositol 1-dehydrogenase